MNEYIKSTAIFICPSDSVKTGSYGYLLNGQNESALANSDTEKLLSETAKRHFDGMNVAYVDGHVKWDKSTGAAETTGFESGTLPADVTMNGPVGWSGGPYIAPTGGSCTAEPGCSISSGVTAVFYKASASGSTRYHATLTLQSKTGVGDVYFGDDRNGATQDVGRADGPFTVGPATGTITIENKATGAVLYTRKVYVNFT